MHNDDNSRKVRMLNLEGYIHALDDVTKLIGEFKRTNTRGALAATQSAITDLRRNSAADLAKLMEETFVKTA
jgi:hypothetical protein